MSGTNSSPSLLDDVAEAAIPESAVAFKQLASEKRLAILVALWDMYEPFEDDQAVPFSVLRDRVGIRDKGQFHYHLTKLEGHFVRRTADGYELRRAGHQFVRTVIAGAGISDPSFDRAEIDQPCHQCGGPTTVTYHDELLYWCCNECDGLFGDHGRIRGGILGVMQVDPAGFTDRRPEEVLKSADVRMDWNVQFAVEGLCNTCSGPMGRRLNVCGDHTADGICPSCRRRYAAIARFRCSVCKNHLEMVPWWLVIGHPAVVAFYYRHGIPVQYEGAVDGEYPPRLGSTLPTHHTQDLVSVNPPRVRVTVSYEGDELRLTLDEDLEVVKIEPDGRR